MTVQQSIQNLYFRNSFFLSFYSSVDTNRNLNEEWVQIEKVCHELVFLILLFHIVCKRDCKLSRTRSTEKGFHYEKCAKKTFW